MASICAKNGGGSPTIRHGVRDGVVTIAARALQDAPLDPRPAALLEPISKLAARHDSFVVSSLAPRCTSMYYLGARCGPSRSRAARLILSPGQVTRRAAYRPSPDTRPPHRESRRSHRDAESFVDTRAQRAAPAPAW